MKTRKGLPGGQYKVISEKDIIKIHETSLKVFAEVGVKVKFPEALELFEKNGAKVDKDNRVVKIPPDMVTEWIEKAPSTVFLCGRSENE
ncbi:MAG: trimethylamine methyltransferase family protein, partial [Desulfobacterales bacterium]